MVYRGLPQLAILWFLLVNWHFLCFKRVAGRCECAFVVLAKLSLHDRIGEFVVGPSLLETLKHVHAAAQVVVHGSGVDRIAAKTLLSDLSSFQEATQGPRWFVDMVEDGAEAAVGEGRIGVVVR